MEEGLEIKKIEGDKVKEIKSEAEEYTGEERDRENVELQTETSERKIKGQRGK